MLWTKSSVKSSPSTLIFQGFDKVPHLDFLKKPSQISVKGYILEVTSDYFDQRRQFVRVDNTSSQLLDVTSGVPKGSVVGPVRFCNFINDLPAALQFSDPYLFADDLKISSKKKNWLKVQSDLDAVHSWAKENKMTGNGQMYQANLQR